MTPEVKCQNCRFFGTTLDPYTGTLGECHRRAPQVVASFATARPMTLFPRVDPRSWCGEFSKAIPQKEANT